MKSLTILWALRSPCDLNCQYCYFGTQEEALTRLSEHSDGILSHSPKKDASEKDVLKFIETIPKDISCSVFLAGGEPLRFNLSLEVARRFKARGDRVTICTNGLPLQSQEMCQSLLNLGIDAISVSLDSNLAEVNDAVRKDTKGRGCGAVIGGIQTFIAEKKRTGAPTKIGIYTVLTRANVGGTGAFYEFLSSLGVNYWVFQPVSLDKSHKMFESHSLSLQDVAVLKPVLKKLYSKCGTILLPREEYIDLVEAVIQSGTRTVKGCFGGRDLFFIQPDGSVWDCPSALKIRQHRSDRLRTICADSDAAAIMFGPSRWSKCTDCDLQSVDCVNMWPLMDFERIIGNEVV